MEKRIPRESVPKTMSITELSQNASGAVSKAIKLGQNGEPLFIVRHSKPVAVLLDIEAFEDLQRAAFRDQIEGSYQMWERMGVPRSALPAYMERLRSEGKTIPWEDVRRELELLAESESEHDAK